ncbi:hypothetical protein HII31_02686 [Pseudocercospora fuligena]|uniref:Srp40 C-terminal domain-containing protein n=1 Tax=Pseudocercospora fuligena TaxID=685502 RepID=A0A8H6VLF2_9PEZI|nr:hypothetical protein HII31_02686 [Pseudocercospora fuligena]
MVDQQVPESLWPHATPAPKLPELLGQIAKFLGDLGYSKTVASLDKDAAKNGIAKPSDSDEGVSLLSYYQPTTPPITAGATDEFSNSSSSDSESLSDSDDESEKDEAEGVLVDVEAEETSDDDSDEKSDSGSSSDSSDSDSSSASEAKAGSKRKRVATPPSSDDSSSSSSSSDESMDDSDSDSSSDESDARPAKRTKVEPVSSPSDSRSGSDSSSSSDSESSSSDSESDSSDSDSSSSSESESEAAPPPKKEKKVKKEPKTKEEKPDTSVRKAYVAISRKEANKDGSQSSATLDAESAGETPGESEENSGMHPDRLKRLPQQQKTVTAIVDGKKKQVPFSRIPADQYVDPRFASNEYVSYDYADRAYQDLVVTKGKGFTKEKNKKKRGKNNSSRLHKTSTRSYRSCLEDEYGWALSPPPFQDDFSLSPAGGNALDFKEDLWDFCAGAGFNRMSGRFLI